MNITADMKEKLKAISRLHGGFTVRVNNLIGGSFNDFNFFYDPSDNKFHCEYKYLLGLLKNGYKSIQGVDLLAECRNSKWWLISEIIDDYDGEIYWKDFKKFLCKSNWCVKELL